MAEPMRLDLSEVVEIPMWDLDAKDLTKEELRNRKRHQTIRHKKRIAQAGLTAREFANYANTFEAAGFQNTEATWFAEENISPESELGLELIEKRRARVKLYVMRGYTREEAIRQCAKDLIKHNKRRGNRADYVISETLVHE